MMMTKMAKKLDIGGYAPIPPDGFESRGGGRRRGKPLLQDLYWIGETGRMDAETQVRNHLSPRGLVGLNTDNLAGAPTVLRCSMI